MNNNTLKVMSTLGARNFAKEDRQKQDYYATAPSAVEMLLQNESFAGPILEPMCGEGHISKVLEAHGHVVNSSDKYYRGYGEIKDLFDIDFWGGGYNQQSAI